GDYERAFGEYLEPGIRIENRSRAPFPDRSASELRATFDELHTWVVSTRTWHSTVRWLSPNWMVMRLDREAVGRDGENYQWAKVHVSEYRDGQFTSVCQFDIEDEDAAFAYADERMRATASRLAVSNLASRVWRAVGEAMRSHDADAVAAHFSG